MAATNPFEFHKKRPARTTFFFDASVVHCSVTIDPATMLDDPAALQATIDASIASAQQRSASGAPDFSGKMRAMDLQLAYFYAENQLGLSKDKFDGRDELALFLYNHQIAVKKFLNRGIEASPWHDASIFLEIPEANTKLVLQNIERFLQMVTLMVARESWKEILRLDAERLSLLLARPSQAHAVMMAIITAYQPVGELFSVSTDKLENILRHDAFYIEKIEPRARLSEVFDTTPPSSSSSFSCR
ncbi:hypothetical protein [Legionella sp. CNM-4043-24]|uniref:hypothetical protein n=1 Tax=Legionella sp. CNM-4043-24 TaxID=3421646 RepID=UPI00403AFC3A